MSLHFSDETQRECSACEGWKRVQTGHGNEMRECFECNGTGRIAGKPDVETRFGTGNGGWNWRPFPLDRTHWRGPFDTEGDALTAARAALTETTE